MKPELGLVNDRQPFEDLRLPRIVRRRFLVDPLRSRIILPFLQFPGLLEIVVQALRNGQDSAVPGNDKQAERKISERGCISMRSEPEHGKKIAWSRRLCKIHWEMEFSNCATVP